MLIPKNGSIAVFVGKRARGKTRFVEKSKSGTFPLRSEIPQGRRDSQFSHRPGRGVFIFSDFTPETGIADLHRIRLICNCQKADSSTEEISYSAQG
jgi:hypothetical protein